VSSAAITLCVASQRVFIVVSVYIVIDSVRKLLDTPSYFLPGPYVKCHSSFTSSCVHHVIITDCRWLEWPPMA